MESGQGPGRGRCTSLTRPTDLYQNESQFSPPFSPSTTKKKGIWDNFRSRAAKTFRSKQKSKRLQEEHSRLSASQPNINVRKPSVSTPGKRVNSHVSFEALINDLDEDEIPKRRDVTGERSMSDPSLSPISDIKLEQDWRSSSADHDSGDGAYEDEVDSGIAVLEQMSPFQDTSVKQRHHVYMEHPFYMLEVVLREGRDLVIRDSCGTSDPYVKFKVAGKQYYKSRTVHKNLNPKWDEKFTIPIEDVYKPVQIKVYDHDRGFQDDPMGSTEIELTSLEINKPTELKLMLKEKGKSSGTYMGFLLMQCNLVPKSQKDKEVFFKRSTVRIGDTAKKLKMQIWSGVVTIVLVDGKNLVSMDDNGFSDPYVKFRLGSEKYRSKHQRKTLNPRWLEQFDLRLFNEQSNHLEISVYDHDVTGRDDFMGRAVIDLSALKREKTHIIDQSLEDGAGFIKLLLTISGTTGETISDLTNYTFDPREHEEVIRKYGVLNSLSNLRDVGLLQVKVFKATGLASADIGGKSDPFCVLELVNSRLQTQTEYKTLNPDWNKVFTFNVKDIHSVLEVTIYDEDRDRKVEFLGKIAIPLLRIRNGEKKWYALKDKKLLRKTKGSILLESDLIYNHEMEETLNIAYTVKMLVEEGNTENAKAAIRTVNPREDKYMQPEPKFKISVMKRNIDRVSQLVSCILDCARFLESCFEWESTPRSIIAFFVFLVTVWNFEIYMLPITLLLLFLKSLAVAQFSGTFANTSNAPVGQEEYVLEDEDDDDDEDKEKDEKRSFRDRLQAIQEVCLQVQQAMDMVASLGERVKNTFNWTVPWLSSFAVIILSIGVIVLYFIPLRYLILAWGINKFTKKLRAPNAIPNNELLDFLSRIPSDNELLLYREFRPDNLTTSAKKKRS